MEQDRDRMRVLSSRLLTLHGVLLDRERRAYEERHGTVDADEPIPPDSLRIAFRETYRLLKSGPGGDFQDKYHLALQDSPDVIMAHAAVSRVLSDADTGPGPR